MSKASIAQEIHDAKCVLVRQLQDLIRVNTKTGGRAWRQAGLELEAYLLGAVTDKDVCKRPGLGKIEQRISGAECAAALGVGRGMVTAIKKMLGISGARSVFASAVQGFMKQYPDFQTSDADHIEDFCRRHPEFKAPKA